MSIFTLFSLLVGDYDCIKLYVMNRSLCGALISIYKLARSNLDFLCIAFFKSHEFNIFQSIDRKQRYIAVGF